VQDENRSTGFVSTQSHRAFRISARRIRLLELLLTALIAAGGCTAALLLARRRHDLR
jgi:hypothetical protein